MKLPLFKSTSALLLLFASLTAFAQAEKKLALKPFNTVTVSSGIDLYLLQGTAESIVVKSTDDLLKDIEIIQQGTNLLIKFKDGIRWGSIFKSEPAKAYLNYKTLAAVSASGGSDVYTQNNLKTSSLTLKASGGSDLKMTLACTNLTVQISGGSDADLSGTAENMDARASGGSDFNAMKLAVMHAKVSASGGSDANVNVSKALEVSASGGSDVNYRGSAALKKSISGGGGVNRVN